MSARFNISNIKSRIGSTDRDPSKIYINPNRDWFVVLGLFFILITGVSVYSYDVFLGVYHKNDVVVDEKQSNQQVRYEQFQRELSSTLSYYREKAGAFEQLVDERPVVFVDPSEQSVDPAGQPPDEQVVPLVDHS